MGESLCPLPQLLKGEIKMKNQKIPVITFNKIPLKSKIAYFKNRYGMGLNEEIKTSIEEKQVIVNSSYSCIYFSKALKEEFSDDTAFKMRYIIKKEDEIKFEPRIIDGKIVTIDIVRGN